LTLTLALRLEDDSNPICTTLCFAAPLATFLSLDHDVDIPYNAAIPTGRSKRCHISLPAPRNLDSNLPTRRTFSECTVKQLFAEVPESSMMRFKNRSR